MKPLSFMPMSLQAWRDNRKEQTRRVMVPPKPFDFGDEGLDVLWHTGQIKCPFGRPGEALWIREALIRGDDGHAYYRFDNAPVILGRTTLHHMAWPWKVRVLAQRFMPKRCARYVIWNKGVRAENLKQISFDDCLAEGVASWPGWGKGIDWEAVWADPDRLIYQGVDPDDDDQDGINQAWTDYVRGVFAEGWDSINSSRGHAWQDNPPVWVVQIPSFWEWQAAVDKGWHRRAA